MSRTKQDKAQGAGLSLPRSPDIFALRLRLRARGSHLGRFMRPKRALDSPYGCRTTAPCGDLDLPGQGYSRVTSLEDLSLYFTSYMADKIRYDWGLKAYYIRISSSFLLPSPFCQPTARSQVPCRLSSLGPRSLPASRATRAPARPSATGFTVAYGTCRKHVFDACFDLPAPLRSRSVASRRPLCVGSRSTGERPPWS